MLERIKQELLNVFGVTREDGGIRIPLTQSNFSKIASLLEIPLPNSRSLTQVGRYLASQGAKSDGHAIFLLSDSVLEKMPALVAA